MATFTSESDTTHLQARRCSVICHTIFFSLTTDIYRVSQNPLVPAAPQKQGRYNDPGVRVHYILLLAVLSIPFRLQSMATLEEGNEWQMWEFIRI